MAESNFWIDLFKQKPYRTAHELVKEVQKIRGYISKQAVYKALRKLIENQIVAKVGEGYLLSSHWLELEIKSLERLKLKLQTAEIWNDLLRNPAGELSQKFSSFQAADNYWVELMLLLLRETKATELFQWHPHFWFILLQPEKEQEFLEILSKQKVFVKAFANPVFQLDRELLKDWPDKYLEIKLTKGVFDRFESTHLTLIGDFILSVTFSQETHLQLLRAFREKRSVDRDVKIQRLFASRQGIRVKVVRSQIKAQKLKRQFELAAERIYG